MLSIEMTKNRYSFKNGKKITKVKPLNACNLGWELHVKFFLKKKNMKGKVKNTVKKYLAQVI